jgi:glycerophosphoryl diester phosphodiesterase
MKIIGHRGASGYAPENTLPSFRQAIRLGVDMVEFDVYTLKTGEVVVFHDDKVNRTTNGKGKIESKTFDEVRALDAGNGEKIPLLTEVLDTINKKVPINIELKGANTARPVAEIIQRYISKKKWSKELFFVSSFDHNELRLFSTLLPTVQTGAIFSYLPRRFWSKLQNSGIFSANINSRVVTKRMVKAAHARGLKVFVYTVNTERQARRMARLNVDGIFSDYPDRVSLLNGDTKTPQLPTLPLTKKPFAQAN